MFGFFEGPAYIKKKCRECGEEYEAPEFGEVGMSHRVWCIPYRMRQAKYSMELEMSLQKMKDERELNLMKQAVREVMAEK